MNWTLYPEPRRVQPPPLQVFLPCPDMRRSDVPTFRPSDDPCFVPATPLNATLMKHPASVDFKQLTEWLTSLDATLTKNAGVGSLGEGLRSARSFALSCRSLHQECFTALWQSSASTLFLKNAGVSPNNSHSGTLQTLRLPDSSTFQRATFRFPTLRLSNIQTFQRATLPPFTICVLSCTVSQRAAPENGIVVAAYHVLHTRHSHSLQSRSPESTWKQP